MSKNLPALTPDQDFLFPYPLRRADEPLQAYLEKLLGTILLTGKIPSKDQRKFASWCALTFYYEPKHTVALDLLKLYKPKLPNFITKSQGAKTAASIASAELETIITTNPALIKALLKRSMFRPYLTSLITEVSKTSTALPVEFLPNLHPIELTSDQKGYKAGSKMYVQHIPPCFPANAYYLAAKRDSLASAAKVIGPLEATYVTLGDPLRTTFVSSEEKIHYTYSLPYQLAKPLYLEIQATMLELWNKDKVGLMRLFSSVFGINDYHLFLRKDNIPVAVTLHKKSSWAATIVSSELGVRVFTILPLQYTSNTMIEDPALNLDTVLNYSLPVYEPWKGSHNYVSYCLSADLFESRCKVHQAPQLSQKGLEAFCARYSMPHLLRQ